MPVEWSSNPPCLLRRGRLAIDQLRSHKASPTIRGTCGLGAGGTGEGTGAGVGVGGWGEGGDSMASHENVTEVVVNVTVVGPGVVIIYLPAG